MGLYLADYHEKARQLFCAEAVGKEQSVKQRPNVQWDITNNGQRQTFQPIWPAIANSGRGDSRLQIHRETLREYYNIPSSW